VEKAGIEPARQRLQGATAAIAAIPDSGPTTQDLNREPPGTDGRPRWARGRMWDASRSAPVHPGRSWNRTTRNRITSTASTRPRDTMRWHRWNWRGLNPRPLRCKRSALPSELQPRCLGCPGPRRGTPECQAVTSACRCVVSRPAVHDAHAVELSTCGHVHPKVVLAGTDRVELSFRRFWRPDPKPLGHPYAG
jgi:hypothetical protein